MFTAQKSARSKYIGLIQDRTKHMMISSGNDTIRSVVLISIVNVDNT